MTDDIDPDLNKHNVGMGLVIASIVLAAAALFVWTTEKPHTTQHYGIDLDAEAGYQIADGPSTTSPANHTPALAMAGVAGIGFLSGCILVAGAAPPRAAS